MDDTPTATPPRPRRARRLAWALGASLLVLALVVAGTGGGLWWALRSDAGTAWLLAHVPGLQVDGGRGRAWGDFAAERVTLALPGGTRLVLTDIAWRGLRAEPAPAAAWRTRVVIDSLTARRVDVLPAAGAALAKADRSSASVVASSPASGQASKVRSSARRSSDCGARCPAGCARRRACT